LKAEERLGEPGSQNRNPNITEVFHETNLAETKGSGIKTMRRFVQEANFAPPTFESNRRDDKFTTRLLLSIF
jgi:ATP-dependent DNA helicase RecG